MYKVLVIEDQLDIRDNLATVLEAEGYEVLEAANGEEGINKAVSERPDLVLCDIGMPVMDGFQVVEQVRGNPDTHLIPFIFLTAKVEVENKQRAIRLGGDDYLTKPFTRSNLLDAIASRLERARLMREFLAAKDEKFRMGLLKTIPDKLLRSLIV